MVSVLVAALPSVGAGPAAGGAPWHVLALGVLAVLAAAAAIGWWRAQRKLAGLQQALLLAKEFEVLMRQLADHLPARISYWDRGNRCRFANLGFCHWHGIEASQMLGRRIDDLPDPWRQRAEANAPHVQAVLQGEVQRFVRDDFDPQGRACVSLAHYVPHRQAGRVVGFVVMATDLSAEKAVERRLRELNQQLVNARDRAETATRAKTVFLANISHEFRTPLNAVLGFTALLRRELPAGKAQAHLGHVGDAARHLLALVNDVIDLSRIETGQVRVTMEDTDPHRLLQRAVDLMQPRAQEKGLDLQLHAQGLPSVLHTDPRRLTQALLNLLGNALKFTEQGGVTVQAWVHASPAHGACLRVEVNDTGPGIALAAQSQLFQPFSQVDGSLTRRHGGSGLGLSITRDLMALLGGTVGVNSLPGQGARFWLELPLTPVAPTPG